MGKRVFFSIVVYLLVIVNSGILYSQSKMSPIFYGGESNKSSLFVGGGCLMPIIGWNGVFEYRYKIAKTSFSFQPAIISYGGELESDRFGYKTQYTNFQLATNFTYGFGSLMKNHFVNLRIGGGLVAGVEYVQSNPIYNTKTWNPVIGVNGLSNADFVINEYWGITLRYQFNYLPKAQVSKMEHILSLGIVFKIL